MLTGEGFPVQAGASELSLDQIRESIQKNLDGLIASGTLTDDAKDFIMMCLAAKEKRPTSQDILSKALWFKEFRDGNKENLDKTILSNVIAHSMLWSLQSAILYQFQKRVPNYHKELFEKAEKYYIDGNGGYQGFRKKELLTLLQNIYQSRINSGEIIKDAHP